MNLRGAWKLHLLESSGSKSSRTTPLQNFRIWKGGKNKYLQDVGFPQLASVILHVRDTYACLRQRVRIIKARTVDKL